FADPDSDILTFYSNYGPAIDIAAPGGDCGPFFEGKTIEDLFADPSTCDFFYLILTPCILPDASPTFCAAIGTSFSAPHVAGGAALVRGLHPDWSPAQVRTWLEQTADKVGSRQEFGAGILNVDAATR